MYMIAVQGVGGGGGTVYVKYCIGNEWGGCGRGYPLRRWGLFWKFGY